jgi:hypothetical protein
MGLVLLVPSARPADAYLSVWRQRMLDQWSYSNQTVKLAGELAVKLSLHTHCSADKYGHASAHGSCKVNQAANLLHRLCVRGVNRLRPFPRAFLNLRDCGRSRHMFRVHGRRYFLLLYCFVLDFEVGLSRLGNSSFDAQLALCRGRQTPTGVSRRG